MSGSFLFSGWSSVDAATFTNQEPWGPGCLFLYNVWMTWVVLKFYMIFHYIGPQILVISCFSK